MSRFVRLASVVAIFAATLAFALPASAAAVQWESIDVTAHDQGENAVLIVTGTLPESTKLPARVALSVPAGAQLEWAGEILGGPVSNDPSVKTQKSTRGDADVYEFTLTQSHIGQVEVLTPPVLKTDAAGSSALLTWTSAEAQPVVKMTARIPEGSSVSRPAEGAVLESGPQGWAYYTATHTDVKPGETLTLDFGFVAPPVQAAPVATQQAPQRSASSTIVPLFLMFVAVGAGIALILAITKKLQAKSSVSQPVVEPTKRDAAVVRSAAGGANTEVAVRDDDRDALPAEHDLPEHEEVVARRRLGPVGVMLVGVAIVASIAVVAVAMSTKPQAVGGALTKSFGGEASACTSTTIALTPREGVDLERSSDQLFDSFTGMQGVGSVTLHVDDPSVTVQFCDSTTSEDAIRAALGSTGLVSF